jgi:hypothetical protein
MRRFKEMNRKPVLMQGLSPDLVMLLLTLTISTSGSSFSACMIIRRDVGSRSGAKGTADSQTVLGTNPQTPEAQLGDPKHLIREGKAQGPPPLKETMTRTRIGLSSGSLLYHRYSAGSQGI